MGDNKVLKFPVRPRRILRVKWNNWNYYQSLFFISLVVNITLFTIFIIKGL